MLIWSDQTRLPLGDLPFPDPSPGGGKYELETIVEILDERRQPVGLGARGGQFAADVRTRAGASLHRHRAIIASRSVPNVQGPDVGATPRAQASAWSSASRSPASIRIGSRFSAGVSGHE